MSYPKKIIIEVTTRCNYICSFCPNQSEAYKNTQVNTDMDFEQIIHLKTVLPFIDNLVFSGFGEPMLNPYLLDMVQYAKHYMAPDSVIGMQTNGSLITEENAKEMVEAGLNKICISVDTIKKGSYHSFYNALVPLQILKNLKNKHKITIGIEIVISKDNIDELYEIVLKLSEYIDFLIISNLIPYTKESFTKVVYDTNNSDSFGIFKKWLSILENKGYNLNDWFDIAKKMAGEGIEYNHEVYAIYKAMYEEAQKFGLTLNLSRLVSVNEKLLENVQNELIKVDNICKSKNIELKIPNLLPTSKRRCEFIEEGCLFINLWGEVSPCYFLWHTFDCYIGDLKKSVQMLSFGNIKERDPISIYNSKEFTIFKDAVLNYGFPYCYDCNFALCDLMELPNFEYDCFSNNIPCGACLWCGGLFNCMI